MEYSDVKRGDKITIELTGTVGVIIDESWLDLKLSNGYMIRSLPISATKLIEKHLTFKVGQEITTTEDLLAMPLMSAVKSGNGFIYQQMSKNVWKGGGVGTSFASQDFGLSRRGSSCFSEPSVTVVSLP